MNATSRTGIIAGLVLGLIVTMAESGRMEANVGERRNELMVEMTVELHGATPSMAWSSDSNGLAVNAAFEYWTDFETLERYESSLGIYVLNLDAKQARHLHKEAGFHPLWVDDETVAWGNSLWNEGTSGVFIGELNGEVRRLVEDVWVFFTLPSINPGKVLFLTEGSWYDVDVKTGVTSLVGPAVGDEFDLVWNGPTDMVADQCLQEVGDTSVAAEDDKYVVSAGRRRYETAHAPFVFKHDWSCGEEGACGPVKACLSPDGKRLAYVTPSYNGYTLYVVKIPRL